MNILNYTHPHDIVHIVYTVNSTSTGVFTAHQYEYYNACEGVNVLTNTSSQREHEFNMNRP